MLDKHPLQNIRSAKNECQNLMPHSKKLQCWEDLIDSVLKHQGIDQAFEIVQKLYTTEPVFASNCHSYVHTIGEKAYRSFSSHQNFTLSPKTSYCGYGFYHAFMESLLLDGGDLNKARQFCDYVDKKMSGSIADAKGACYHGIGHGTADNHDQKYWHTEQALVTPGLKLCEKVAPDDVLLDRCSSGVFNVLAIAYTSNRVKLDPPDPLQFCRQFTSSIYKKTCFEEMNTALISLSQGNFATAVGFTQGIADPAYAHFATRSLAGAVGMSRVSQNDFSKEIKVCQSLKDPLNLSCFNGFVGGLIEGGQPNTQHIKALKFCQNSSLKENEQAACFKEAFRMLSVYYTAEEYKQMCKEMVEKYKNFCIS